MAELPTGYSLDEAIDVAAAHAYLARSYWSPNIPFATVAKALANSLSVAVRKDGEQVALARVVTDRATFAYLADVYVLEEHRWQGLARAMVAWLQDHPELAVAAADVEHPAARRDVARDHREVGAQLAHP